MIVLAVRKPYQVREIVPRVSDAKTDRLMLSLLPLKQRLLHNQMIGDCKAE